MNERSGATRRSREAAGGGAPGALFDLVRRGEAPSRALLAERTGLAMSTIGKRVDGLIRAGYLVEEGSGASRGGRRPRALAVASAGRVVAGVDFGSRHADLALYDLAGRRLARDHAAVDLAAGPDAVLAVIHDRVRALIDATAPESRRELAGVGLAVPGPVDVHGLLVSPARMPGWNGVDTAALSRAGLDVPTFVENDANAMALGEHVAGGRRVDHLVVVKAGSSIGSGVIAGGALHRGHRGMAGDISHTAVASAPPIACSCGRLGCLDAVAGGRAVVRELRASGVEVEDTGALLALASDSHPAATRLLREAGMRVGTVLADIVNFFNPQRLAVAGSLSSADAFTAGVRSSIYSLCPPMATEGLEVGVGNAEGTAGVDGAAVLALDHLLDPETIDGVVTY